MFFPFSAYHWIKSAGRPRKARLSQWAAVARRIVKESDAMGRISSEQLLSRSRDIQWQAKTGTPLKSLLLEAFSLVRESARRVRGMPHYPVQLVGGIAMLNGQVAEMQTGEGKTLTAVLTAYLRALVGRGCHVVTVNDYLARRDAEWLGPIYQSLGISVGCIQADMEPDERRTATTATSPTQRRRNWVLISCEIDCAKGRRFAVIHGGRDRFLWVMTRRSFVAVTISP